VEVVDRGSPPRRRTDGSGKVQRELPQPTRCHEHRLHEPDGALAQLSTPAMQGFVSKLVGTSARRLSNGSLSGLPTSLNACTPHCMPAPTTIVRRHSISAVESFSAPHLHTNHTERATRISSFLPSPSFPREITWLAGAPGAGKGTNSTFVASSRGYDAPTIVVSSLLDSPECKRIKDAGGMVDDEVVFKVLLQELAKPEYKRGVVVDGFPRTEKQAVMISKLHDSVSSPTTFNFVTLFIDEQASIQRQLSRGDAIRKLNTVRQASGLEPLEERATDTCENAARLRYSNFMQQYEAINKLSARFPLAIVDASAPIEVVRQRLSAVCTTPASRPFRRASLFSTLQQTTSSENNSQQQQLAYL
jgi:adenylate kinase family enzyme